MTLKKKKKKLEDFDEKEYNLFLKKYYINKLST